jgi:D-xylose transport system permease protein
LELDTRLLGMIGAFVVICLVFNVFTDGRFMTPRNIFNLTIQTASVAIMATGMVFVIVTRHIDLSVGSLLATVLGRDGDDPDGFLPQFSASATNNPATMPIAVVVGIGRDHRRFPGLADRLSGHSGLHRHPWRFPGLAQRRLVHLTSGQTIGPLDENFQLIRRHQRHARGNLELDLRIVAIACRSLA